MLSPAPQPMLFSRCTSHITRLSVVGRSLGGGLRGRLGCRRRRAVGRAARERSTHPRCGQHAPPGRAGRGATRPAPRHAAMQGQDQRHQYGQQATPTPTMANRLGTHRRHHPRLAQRRQAGVSAPRRQKDVLSDVALSACRSRVERHSVMRYHFSQPTAAGSDRVQSVETFGYEVYYRFSAIGEATDCNL